jgi:prephenate dehydratase
MDLLADRDFKLKIIQEIDIQVELQLFAIKGHKDIKRIISHPQPLAQSQHFLRKNYPGVVVEPVASTAAAVEQIVKKNLTDTAAIASSRASNQKLEILSSDIADYPDNVTRFVVLSKHPIKNVEKQKTSIVFSPGSKDKPGGLYDILGHFNNYQINLTKIESRPQKRMIGSYLFFVDFEGSSDDQNVKTLLKELGQITSFFKNLGSYPVDI